MSASETYRWKHSSDVDNWHLTGRKPARLLMIDTRVANLGMDVAEDMINALENVIAVICHMSGPSKMPLFGLYGLDNTSEMLLPLTHLKGNLSRIQTSLRDLRSLMESAINETLSGCIEQAIKEAYGQFRRQVYQNIRGIPDSCQQLEIILMTQQPREIVQRQLDTVAISLESQYLTKIQVVIIGHGFDNECTKGCDDDCSQGSSVGSNESPLSGIIEITSLDASPLSFQRFFSDWLLDHNTDREHLHLVIPSKEDGGSELIIKCDLRERLINPSDLPFKEEYFVDVDTVGAKQLTSASKVTESKKRLFRMVARKLLLSSSICESLVFGMPMVVQPTACWRMDWDELESQQQNFKSLCIELFEKGLAVLVQMDSVCEDHKQKNSVRQRQQTDKRPKGYFVLLPSLNGTMLLKPIAAGELILPCQPAVNMLDACSSLAKEIISNAISKIEICESCNPFDWMSGLYDSLKAKGCPSSTQRPTKRKNDSSFNPPSISDF